jgi:O-antigen/teichoic acid export membrane protein
VQTLSTPADSATSPPVRLSGPRRLLLDIGGTFGTRALVLPFNLLSGILIARLLQPEGKGLFTTVATIADLVVDIATLGVFRATTYYVARSASDRQTDRQTRAASLWLSLWLGLGSTLLLVGAAVLAPRWAPELPPLALLLAAPMGLAAMLRSLFSATLRGEHRPNHVNVVTLAFSALLLTALALLGLTGLLSLELAVLGRTCATALAGLLALLMVLRGPVGVPWPRADWPVARALLAFGVPAAVAMFLETLHYRIDVLLIQAFLESRDVGYYSIATNAGELLWLLPSAVGLVLFPRVAATRRRDGATETTRLACWTLGLTAPAALSLGAVAELVIVPVYGAAYLPSFQPLRLLLPGLVVMSAAIVLTSSLLGQGRLRGLVVVNACSIVTNAALNVLLLPRFGLNGAAVASSLSYALTAFATLLLYRAAMRAGPAPGQAS